MAASELGNKYVIVVAKSMQATLKPSLKAHQQISKKNGVSKIIVRVIKHANFQLYRVHPDGVT